jgi:hypothetical protein
MPLRSPYIDSLASNRLDKRPAPFVTRIGAPGDDLMRDAGNQDQPGMGQALGKQPAVRVHPLVLLAVDEQRRHADFRQPFGAAVAMARRVQPVQGTGVGFFCPSASFFPGDMVSSQ